MDGKPIGTCCMSQAANWTWFRANAAQNKKIKQKVNYDVQFTDMLEVQNIRHKLCVARTALSKNKEVVGTLKNDSSLSTDPAQPLTGLGTRIAEQFQRELESQIDRSDNLLIRLDGAASLVSASSIISGPREADWLDWEHPSLPRRIKG